MANFYKVLSVLAPIVAVSQVAACGDAGSTKGDPEAQHCEQAAQRLTRDIGTIHVIETKPWTADNVRSVRVRFTYPEGNAAGLSFGAVLCTYAFDVAVRSNDKRNPKAQTVYFRARNLSENELLLLNMGLRGTKPEFKIK